MGRYSSTELIKRTRSAAVKRATGWFRKGWIGWLEVFIKRKANHEFHGLLAANGRDDDGPAFHAFCVPSLFHGSLSFYSLRFQVVGKHGQQVPVLLGLRRRRGIPLFEADRGRSESPRDLPGLPGFPGPGGIALHRQRGHLYLRSLRGT